MTAAGKNAKNGPFIIKKGTNISHWLSQSEARGEERRNRISRSDYKRIAGWGFDHVRLPIDEEQMWHEDGTRDEEAFALLNCALDWCHELGLITVVDLHILRSHHFIQKTEPTLYTDPKEAEHFASLWDDLSSFMKDRPLDRIAYELMNEPVASDPEDWNRVYSGALAAIRRNEPERTVILGSNRFQSFSTFDDLKIPDDRHLILSFHFYEPFVLTHYRASWTWLKDYTGPVHYPGESIRQEDLESVEDPELRSNLSTYRSHFDRRRMKELLAQPLAARERTGLPLYCGEFGCIQTAPDAAIRSKWYRDIVSVFSELDIAWANWDYKGGFGILDRTAREPSPVLEALTGSEAG